MTVRACMTGRACMTVRARVIGRSRLRLSPAARRGCLAGVLAVAISLAAVPGLAALPGPVAAEQRRLPRIEDRMLRDASALEARGDLAGAEAALRELLRLRPGASSAVLALERVLGAAGHIKAVLPVADAFLAADPSAGTVWSLKLRVLVEADSLSTLDQVVGEWARAVPGSTEPYREGARVYLDALGPDEAVALLEDGLKALAAPPELLVALGEVHVSVGRIETGAEAWAQALGRDRAQTAEVLRRLEGLAADSDPAADLDPAVADGDPNVDDGADQLRRRSAAALVSALGAEGATASQLEIGAEIALREGLEDEARAMAEAVLERFADREARGWLRGFARRAEDLDRPESALWAYSRLAETAQNESDGRANDERMASVALAAGDTTAALGALARVTASHRSGSDERRAAWTAELRLRIVADDLATVRATFARYQGEYPDAPELDQLSAALASRLMRSGDVAEAMVVLHGIEGPGAALERAYLLLEGGAIAEGAAALQASLPDLESAHATEVLALALALSRLTPPGARLAASAAVAAHRGDPVAAVRAVEAGTANISASDLPAVLALGARAADAAGLADEAVAFRRAIVADHADAPEFPEAALHLARAMASHPGGADEAARLLEEQIGRAHV